MTYDVDEKSVYKSPKITFHFIALISSHCVSIIVASGYNNTHWGLKVITSSTALSIPFNYATRIHFRFILSIPVESANKPHITKSRTWLRHFDRATKTLKQELLADSTFLNATDIVWTNQKSFNHITFELESMYAAPPLPPEPEYVRSSKIGIIQNKIYLNVSKIPLGGELYLETRHLL